MFINYDNHLGTFDDFNKDIFLRNIDVIPTKIHNIFIESDYLFKYDIIDNNYYVTSSINLYIDFETDINRLLYQVNLNEYVYLKDSYKTEEDGLKDIAIILEDIKKSFDFEK